MSDQDEINRQQLAAIGDRYLLRTRSEMPLFAEALAMLRAGDRNGFSRLQQLAHKVHGSGAMFGFDLLSERAHEVEALALAAKIESLEQIEQRIHALTVEIEDACRTRGV